MRFIGNKENLIDKIYQVIKSQNIKGDSIFDVFAGTASVGKYFKNLNYQVFSSDIMYFSYVLQRAYIVNNQQLDFKNLLEKINIASHLLLPSPLLLVVEYLNQIEPVEGFIYKNYTISGTSELEVSRMYFSDENGKKIDAIRQKIEEWRGKGLINENEYFVLLACLIETVPFYSNTTGVYAAFQKKWDPRAIKRFTLRTIKFVLNKKDNYSFNDNSLNLTNKIVADIFYLDPPYNQRQYAPNYHILETLAKYDSPEIKGIAGLRGYDHQKSNFCNAKNGIVELSEIAKTAKCKTLILSYNTEGIMPREEIFSTLKEFGKVDLVEFEYLRFKSNNGGEARNKKFIKEQLYILQKNEK